MKFAQKSAIRLKNILKQDKEKISQPFLTLIKNDIYSLLLGYLNIDLEDVDVSYFVGEDCKYHFNISVVSSNIKHTNYIS